MTNDQFRELVRQMREAQTRFFRSRDPQTRQEALIQSRTLERKVDEELATAGQSKLFGNERSRP